MVNKTSSYLDLNESTHCLPLSRHHFDMNKFVDPENVDYIQVKEVIEEMVAQSPRLISRLASEKHQNPGRDQRVYDQDSRRKGSWATQPNQHARHVDFR